MSQRTDTNDLLAKLSELQSLYKSLTQRAMNEYNISASALNLIDLLGEEKATLKAITEMSQLDKSTISRQMNTLVKNNLVVKTTGEDKRFAYFTLSDDAKELYLSYNETFKKRFSDTLAGWTEEEKHLLSVLLGRLNRSLTHGMKSF